MWTATIECGGYRFQITNWDRYQIAYDHGRCDYSPEWAAAAGLVADQLHDITRIMDLMEQAPQYIDAKEQPYRKVVYRVMLDALEDWPLDGFEQWREQLAAIVHQYDDEGAPKLLPKWTQTKRQEKREAWVYLLRSVSGHYKIGRAIDPNNRLKTFHVMLPFEVEFDCLIKSDDSEYVTLERSLHKRFADKRINGEWFALDSDDVAYIRELAEAAS